ncbi:MAG: GNAT family N-acetyltransferase [Pedobacter sp.]
MRDLKLSDLPDLERILRDTGAFTEEEVACAMELLEIVLDNPSQRDYLVAVAEVAGAVAGYVLYGPTPLTSGNVTLYWIAVSPRSQGQGVGQRLMEHVERYGQSLQGRLICLETSSQGSYERTRTFYSKAGYLEESCIKDFYRPGDDRITFIKRLQNQTETAVR